jgi:hypothetical protein
VFNPLMRMYLKVNRRSAAARQQAQACGSRCVII